MLKDSLYLDELDQLIFKEQKIVTYRWLSKKFNIPSTLAKQVQLTKSRILYQFSIRNENKLCPVYFLSGLRGSDLEHIIELVPESKLCATEKKFEYLISKHIYSISAAIPSGGTQIWLDEEELLRSLPSESLKYVGSAISCRQILEENTESQNIQTESKYVKSRSSTITDTDPIDLMLLVQPIVASPAFPNFTTVVDQEQALTESKRSKPLKEGLDKTVSPLSQPKQKVKTLQTLTKMFPKSMDLHCRSTHGSPNIEFGATSPHLTTLQIPAKAFMESPDSLEIVLGEQTDQKSYKRDDFHFHQSLGQKALLDDPCQELDTESSTKTRNTIFSREAREYGHSSVVPEKDFCSVQNSSDKGASERHAESSICKALPAKEERFQKRRVQKPNSANLDGQSGIGSMIRQESGRRQQRDMFDRYFSKSNVSESEDPSRVNDSTLYTTDSACVHRITESETFINDRGYMETRDIIKFVREKKVPENQQRGTDRQEMELKDALPLPRESRNDKLSAVSPSNNPERSRTIETFFKKS